VSRSLASCQGALLLVDSSQSIQAQTLANHGKAKALGLTIIPVVTKIDLPNAQPEETALSMGTTFALDPDTVIMTSAKAKIGVDQVLHAIVDTLPSPRAYSQSPDGPFLGRVVDSWFDEHRGVVILIQAVSGRLVEGQRITTFASIQESKDIDSRSDFSVQEIGVLTPQALRTSVMATGQVCYVIAGLRSTRQARIGDTMYVPLEWKSADDVVPLIGYEAAKQMLFASIFPVDTSQLEDLFAAVDRLVLNDSSISVTREQSSSLGSGLRCGFLGFLHMEVFNQRLKDEFDMDIVMTTPSVPYQIHYEDGSPHKEISSVAEWPNPESKTATSSSKFSIFEPIVKVMV
jgi:elongation factor 4